MSYDLLDTPKMDIVTGKQKLASKILGEDSYRNMYVHGVTEVEVKSTEEALEAFYRGQKQRSVSATLLNLQSSRSHSIFNIRVVAAPLCFHNQFVRPNKKKPAQEVGDSNDCVVIRKRKIFNGVNAEKFNIYETSSKNEKDSSLKSYNELEACDLFEEKQAYLHDARIHIQYCFQRYEPSQAVEKLKGFWDGGIGLLSDWFEWIVDGSKYGDLSKASLEMLPKVLNIVEQFILSKRGEVYEEELNRSKRHALASNGNDIMYQVFLIRDLAKLFKNRGEKLIFIDGEDVEIFDENYPNIFLRKENVMGEATFREKVVFHLRIGNEIVIENVSLCEALAGIVQLFYSFYLHYPSEADELFNVVQRFICNYTTKDDTVINKKGALKKSFKDFEVKLHNFIGYMTNFW